MTARENPASEPVAGAAAQRPDPARQPGQTVDPDQAGPGDRRPGPGHLYRAEPLGRQRRDRGQPGLPRLPLANAIRAMSHATTGSEAGASAVIEQPCQGQD